MDIMLIILTFLEIHKIGTFPEIYQELNKILKSELNFFLKKYEFPLMNLSSFILYPPSFFRHLKASIMNISYTFTNLFKFLSLIFNFEFFI